MYWLKRIAVFLLIALLFACAPKATPTPQLTVTDDLGRSVTIATAPQKIVSLAPSNTEILFALGLGDKVVATDNYSDFPAEAKDKLKVGSAYPGFNMERIIELEPDLILAIAGLYLEQFEALGFPLVVLDPKDLDHVLRNIELVGKITGTESKAKEITADMRQRIERVQAKLAEAEKPRVFWELDATDPTKPWTAGPGTFINELISYAGGDNIASRGATKWFQMSSEEIISLNPQVIILADAQYGVTKEMVMARPGWKAIEAVKTGAIYPIDSNLTDRPGPRLVLGLEELAKILHPEFFR